MKTPHIALLLLAPAALLLLPTAAQAQHLGVGAGVSLISSDATFDQDGEKTDRDGTFQEIPAVLRASFRLTQGLAVTGWTSYVRRSLENDAGTVEGAGPREVGASATYGRELSDGLSGNITLGAKLDLGTSPLEADLEQLPTSNGQHAAYGGIAAAYNLGPTARLTAGLDLVYNLTAEHEGVEFQDGLLLTPRLAFGYGLDLGGVFLSFALDARFTYGLAYTLDGQEVPDSSFYLLHLIPSLSAGTEFGTLTAELGAPLEDFDLGFTLLGKNALYAIPLSIGYSIRL